MAPPLPLIPPPDIVEPEDCASFPCMIFEDNFDFLDHDVWEHEISAAGGGVSRVAIGDFNDESLIFSIHKLLRTK